jgi:hypothetical protein
LAERNEDGYGFPHIYLLTSTCPILNIRPVWLLAVTTGNRPELESCTRVVLGIVLI